MKAHFSASNFVVNGTRLLRLYSLYSLLLAILLVVLTTLDHEFRFLGSERPLLMLASSVCYLVLAAVFSALAVTNPDPQVTTGYIFIEIILLVCMMFASGDMATGFTSLIAIAVVVCNLLTPGVLGYGAAAWTTIAIIYTQIFLADSYVSQDPISIGLYGFLCFILSWITQTLARRLKSALSLTTTQARHIQRLQQMSQQALQSLPSAVLACDRQQQVLFANQAAQQWFAVHEQQPLPSALITHAKQHSFNYAGQEYLARKMPLKGLSEGDYLLTIDRSEQLAAAAQQIKLASLGRLTASIAHEIRNPLSALKQAAQLLKEADYLHATERQLSGIIDQQSERINKIIEDVLQLSRRKQATPSRIHLASWLEEFSQQFQQQYFYEEFQLNLHCGADITVLFDSSQLQQILHNLCGNGLRYAVARSGKSARLSLVAQPQADGSIQLDVLDNGGGVPAELEQHLFEPFFTSEHQGTGLGLYLSKELCEANQGSLHYKKIPHGACFRITMNSG